MSKSALEPLVCPQCGGEVELDNEQEYGFCKYCGTKVQNTNFKIIKGKIKVDGIPTVDNYMILADRDYEQENYTKALDYYNKVLEIDANNWKALFRKNICLFREDCLSYFNFYEIDNVILNIIDSNNDLKKDKNNILMLMASEMFELCDYCAHVLDIYSWENKYNILEFKILDFENHILILLQQMEDQKESLKKEKNKLLEELYENALITCKSIEKKMIGSNLERDITLYEESIKKTLLSIEDDNDSLTNKRNKLLEMIYRTLVISYIRLIDRRDSDFESFLKEYKEAKDILIEDYNEAVDFLKKRNPNQKFESIEEKLTEIEEGEKEEKNKENNGDKNGDGENKTIISEYHTEIKKESKVKGCAIATICIILSFFLISFIIPLTIAKLENCL